MNKKQQKSLELKTKWIEELRSGKHRQATNTLKSINMDGEVGYCCLGVFREIVQGVPVKAEKDWDIRTGGAQRHYYGMMNVIPICTDTLAGMNDNFEKTFEEIADYIEQEWKV